MNSQEHISKLVNLFMLSTTLFDQDDDSQIMRLVASAVPALAPVQVEGGYLMRDGRLVPSLPVGVDAVLCGRLAALAGG